MFRSWSTTAKGESANTKANVDPRYKHRSRMTSKHKMLMSFNSDTLMEIFFFYSNRNEKINRYFICIAIFDMRPLGSEKKHHLRVKWPYTSTLIPYSKSRYQALLCLCHCAFFLCHLLFVAEILMSF